MRRRAVVRGGRPSQRTSRAAASTTAAGRRDRSTRSSTRLGTDGAFYAGLRNRGRTTAADGVRPWPDVSLASFFRAWDGYGLMAEYLALGMQRAGARVASCRSASTTPDSATTCESLLASSRSSPSAPAIWFAPPQGVTTRSRAPRDLFINTMWESSRLPHGWTATLNAARAVIVPTRYVAEVCRRSGVEAPVEVVPEGVDPGLYPYVDRPDREGLTTLARRPARAPQARRGGRRRAGSGRSPGTRNARLHPQGQARRALPSRRPSHRGDHRDRAHPRHRALVRARPTSCSRSATRASACLSSRAWPPDCP